MQIILTGITAAAFVLWLLWERINPAFETPSGWKRLLRNAGLGALGLAATLAIVTPVSVLASGLSLSWRSDWPLLFRVLTELIALELFIYAWHRAMHEVPQLWRFHRVHHYDEFLDVSSAIRFHPGEVTISAFLRAILIIALDISVSAILIFDSLVLIAAAFHHSNIMLSEAWDRRLRLVFVTPRHHRIHHIPKRQYTDSNYGTVLSIWDRVFSSYKDPSLDGCYGVENEKEKSLAALVVDPFKPT